MIRHLLKEVTEYTIAVQLVKFTFLVNKVVYNVARTGNIKYVFAILHAFPSTMCPSDGYHFICTSSVVCQASIAIKQRE